MSNTPKEIKKKNLFDLMKYNSIEEKTEDIILNLKIIGSIQKKDKLSKSEEGILEIESNDFLQSARRWYYGRSRNDTLTNIKIIITTSFDIIDKTLVNEKSISLESNQYFNEENSNLLQRFLVEMNNACKGLDNLKSTYNNDIKVASEIDCLKEQLQLRIKKINTLLKIDKDVIHN